jgi:hypothetical protein
MMSKETLDAVRNGILTDAQLKEALQHYTELEKNLKLHGEIYHLVWFDVFNKLDTLKYFWKSRTSHRKLAFTIDGLDQKSEK